MSPFGFLIVLAAAFCHAGWNFFVKRINGGPELVWLFSAVSVVIYLPVAFYVLPDVDSEFGLRELVFVLASAGLHMAYFLLLQRGYRQGDLSLVYPVARATGPFLATLFALLFLGEQASVQLVIGAIAIIVGVVCMTGGPKAGIGNATASLLFGLSAGFLIGTYTVWDAFIVSVLLVPPVLLDYASSIVRALALAPTAWTQRSQVRRHWQDHRTAVIAISVLNPLAYILVLYALTFTPVVYVAPTRELSVLITVVLGAVVLGEARLAHRLPWATLILAGVALLATS